MRRLRCTTLGVAHRRWGRLWRPRCRQFRDGAQPGADRSLRVRGPARQLRHRAAGLADRARLRHPRELDSAHGGLRGGWRALRRAAPARERLDEQHPTARAPHAARGAVPPDPSHRDRDGAGHAHHRVLPERSPGGADQLLAPRGPRRLAAVDARVGLAHRVRERDRRRRRAGVRDGLRGRDTRARPRAAERLAPRVGERADVLPGAARARLPERSRHGRAHHALPHAARGPDGARLRERVLLRRVRGARALEPGGARRCHRGGDAAAARRGGGRCSRRIPCSRGSTRP
jgi:hypothetical protein